MGRSSSAKATVLDPHGPAETIDLPVCEAARLRLLKLLVGEPLAVVPLPNERLMLLHEEAKNQPHFVNVQATLLALEAQSIPPDDYIAGIAVIVPRDTLR